MRFDNHVSIQTDLVCFLDYSPAAVPVQHDYVGATPPFVLPVVPHVETPVMMCWVPGFYIGKNKFSKDVLHKHLRIALDKHDCGPLIPHIFSAPPDNVMLVVRTLLSKRKVNFSVGDVKMTGKPVAAATMFDLAVIPTPMTPCSLIPIPSCGTGSAVLTNEVIVGMHWIDLVVGWVTIAIDIVAAVAKRRGGSTGDRVGALPKFSGIIVGLIQLAGQEWGGYRGDATVSATVEANDNFQVGAELARAGDSGRWSAKRSSRLGRDSANLREETTFSWGGGGGAAPTLTQQGGAEVLGTSGDLGVSTRRPGDGGAGAYATGSSPVFGGGSTPLGESIAGFPQL